MNTRPRATPPGSLFDAPEPTAHDMRSSRDPWDWYIEVCAVCGAQLGPGIGSRTQTGRCVYEEHRSTGGIVVRVVARPDLHQAPESQRFIHRIRDSWRWPS